MPILYFFISIGASIVGAISGIGGGVIIKPVLDSISPFDVSTISFLSGTTVLSMTIVTLFRSRKSSVKLDKRIGSLMAAGGIIGGLLGKMLFDLIKAGFGNDRFIGATQSLMLALITTAVVFFTLYKDRIKPFHKDGNIFSISIGLILGGIASFLGIGGGPINLAVLYFFFSMDSKTAALSSIFIIFFSQITNLIFTISSGNVPVFDPFILALMITGGIAGGLLGSHFSRKMTHKEIDHLFIGIMAVIILICIYNFTGFLE
ncbi:MAG: hypothetical protein B6241_10955 [Spirochaetaceae bacterium 4572_59]|nr:MAG: hypothetical protein B6241_10955 [Spirochaetaceae bacterium 4572_59]